MSVLDRIPNQFKRRCWLRANRLSFVQYSAKRPCRLLVDVSAIIQSDARTGIQRVVRAVWSELYRRSGKTFEVVPVFATSEHGYCFAPLNFLDVKPTNACEPAHIAPGDKFIGLDLAAHVLPKYVDQLRTWRANGASVHLFVYDLLPLINPTWFTSAACVHFRNWLKVLINEADQALCISDAVASELRELVQKTYRRNTVKIDRVRLGADIAASLPSAGVCNHLKPVFEQFRFRRPVLMVGTIEPRKGYEVALAAFDYLWRTRPEDSPDLVIIGRAGWKTDDLQKTIRRHRLFGTRLHWFDQMTDEGLCALYDLCRGILIASRGEGLGLPIIEAAAHRRYVLARDLAVFREQALPNIVYFVDDRPESLSNKLLHLCETAQFPAPAARVPTWAESVDGLLDLLQVRDCPFQPALEKVL